ncbi:AAA family ATPase [Calidifontibacter terrae]
MSDSWLEGSGYTPPTHDQQVRRKVDRLRVDAEARERFQREEAAARRPRLNLTRSKEVRKQKPPPFLIDSVLPQGGLFQIFGQTGSYKSYVVVAMCAAVANGSDFMGYPVAASGLVAMVLGEGGADAGERIEAWLAGNPGQSDEDVVYSVEQGLDLMDDQQVETMIEDLQAYATERGKPWRLVVFDTQADHMASGDEDKAKDFSVVKKAIQRIGHATGAAVGLVHHTGWDTSRERGSSRQRQALDVVMQIESNTITNVKQKFGPVFPPIRFVTQQVESVGERGNLFVRRSSTHEDLASATEAYSRVTERLVSNGRHVLRVLIDDPGLSHNRLAGVAGIGKATLGQVREWLADNGFVELQHDGQGRVVGMEVTDIGRQEASAGGSGTG